MNLDDTTKELLRTTHDQHRDCGHKNAGYCITEILDIVGNLRGLPIDSDEEFEACSNFIADAVLEGLILKGLIEISGLTEDGEYLIGLTEDGEKITQDLHGRFR